jgi:hypothetical protein
MVLKNLKVLVKEDIDLIHIGTGPELIPIVTRIEDWRNSKSEFSKIPFEDNTFWESNPATVYYLDTLDTFCPGKVCRNNSTKGWLFHDEAHLSEAGASRLLPELDYLVKEILTKNLKKYS